MLPHTMRPRQSSGSGCQRYSEPVQPYGAVILGRLLKVVVMQRCHQQDLSGHLLEQGGWEHLRLPAEYEAPPCVTSMGWSDPRTEQRQLLWSERFGAQEIQELKRSLGSYAAAGQLQQRPTPSEGG